MALTRSAWMFIAGIYVLLCTASPAFAQTAGVITAQAAQVLPISPEQPDPLLTGTMHYRLGNYEEALDDLTKARLKDPLSAVAAYYLGATLKKMQLYSKALPHLTNATALQPPVTAAYLDLADVYYVLGKNDEALKALASAEKQNVDPSQTAFLKGLVLIKKRSYAEAEASLEKARKLDPRLSGAVDFQIATIFHRQGKQAEARERFLAVAEKDPESEIGQMAGQQADALAKRLLTERPFSAVVSAMFQFDSNVVLKPDNAAAAASISNQSDTALVVAARAEYGPAVPAPYSLKLQYALYLSRYQDLSAYDVTSHTLSVAPARPINDGTLSAPVSYNLTNVHGSPYLKAISVAPVYVFNPVEGQQAHASLRLQKKDFQSPVAIPDEDRDSTETALGLSWYWPFGRQQGFVNARYEINREDAKGRNWSYLGNRFNAGVLYPASELLKLSLGIEAYLQDYENVNLSFNTKRKDTTTTVTAQALYSLGGNIDAHVMYVYMKDASTIDVYAFSKNIFSVGLYARF